MKINYLRQVRHYYLAFALLWCCTFSGRIIYAQDITGGLGVPIEKPKPVPRRAKNTNPAKSNVIGTWRGRYFRAAATLVINSQKGNSFSGTLSCVGFLVSISGSIDQDTRQLIMKETGALKTKNAQYETWYLGTNRGSISRDGKTMSGTGSGSRSYSWVFSRR